MGKASVELPEPENLSSPTGENADDLLSQMAGAEIDRLLAEADVDSDLSPIPTPPAPVPEPVMAPPAPPPAAPAAAIETPVQPASVPQDVATGSPADEILDSFVTADIAPDESSQTPGSLAITDIAGDGSDIVDRSNSAEPMADSRASVAPPALRRAEPVPVFTSPAVSDPSPAIAPEMAPTDIDDESPPSAARLLAEELDSPSLVRVLSNMGEEADLLPPAPATVPLILKPLVWINAPFASLPESTRNVIGKIALWTLLHATAILAYVLFVRK